MSVVGKKEFTVYANSPEEAEEKADMIYCYTDLLDDVCSVDISSVSEKSDKNRNPFSNDDCDNCDRCPYGLKSECEAFRDRAKARNEF